MGKFKITQSPASKNIFLYPESNGCVNDCFAFGDMPNFACVDDKWDALEPETTYAWMEGVTTCSELYAMGNHGSITGSINYVKAHCKAKSDKYAPHVDAVYKVAISNGTTMGYTTLTLRPNAPGAFTQWLCATDPTHWEAVDEVVCDNFTTAIREGTNGDKDYFNLPNHTTETGTITKVEVFVCATGNVDDATLNLAIYDTSSTNVINHSTTWTFAAGWNLQSHVFATNPDGGSWTWSDIDDLQIGVEKTGGTFPYVSQMYVEITYESGYICNGFAMSDNMPLCTGYGLFGFAWMESPWTDTDWTWDEVDNLQQGFECSSPSVIMTPFAVLPIADGDRTDITNVTTGYEHWEAIEKEKPYSEVFESGVAWKYDLYKFVQAGTDYYPSGVGADERKFFPFEHNGKDYVMLCGYLPGIYVYEWTGEYLKLIAHDVTTEEALCVAFDGTYFYVGGSDAANGIVMAYTFDGENLTHVGTDYAAGINSPLNISINGSIESNDGYIYFTGANGQLEALTFDGSTFTQEGIIAGTSIWIYCDGTYIHANKRAFSFDGTNFTNICGGGNDFIMAGDGTYLYATDDDGFNSYIRAYTFDGSAYTLVGSIGTGATGQSYMLCCSLPVFDGYIYAFVNTGGAGGEVRAYSFDGTSFTLIGSTPEVHRKTYMYSDSKFLYTTEFGNPVEGSSKIFSFNGSEFTTLATVHEGTTPKYLDDNIVSVTVVAKMGKDPSAADQADIRGCFNIKTGGSEFNTSTDYFTLETKQRYYVHTWTENPDTVAAWTLAEVQALQAGIGLYGTGSKYATCSRCYIVIGTVTNISPEIKTCQSYLKVNYTPEDTTCWMPKPQVISTNHARNVKMLNFWNGEREVYDENRSGKSMVLTGKINDRKGGVAWCDTDYAFRKKITVDHTQVNGDLVDFPVYIHLDLNKKCLNLQGYDIMFCDSSCSEYSFEVENYSSNGILDAWVQIPSVSSSVDTVFWIYYRKSGVTVNPSTTDVWDDVGYSMVQHMKDTTADTITGSTDAHHVGTKGGANIPNQDNSNMYKCQNNKDNDEHCIITIPNHADLNMEQENFTFSVWVKAINNQGIAQDIIPKKKTVGKSYFIFRQGRFVAGDYAWFQCYQDVGNHFYSENKPHCFDGTWHLLHYVVDRSKIGTLDVLKTYYDGVFDDNADAAAGNPDIIGTEALIFFYRVYSLNHNAWEGCLEEVRFAKGTMLSTDWMAAEYANQKPNSTFVSYGYQQENYVTIVNACAQIICVRDMTRDGTIVTISGLNPTYFNGEYRINSFGWQKISEKIENYDWILELESAY